MDWLGSIEESRSVTELKETSLTHSLLDDDVHNLTHGLGVSSVGAVDVLSVDSVLSFVVNLQLNLSSHQLCVNEVRLIKSLGGPNVVTRVDVLTDEKLDFFSVSIYNLCKLERSHWRSIAASIVISTFFNTDCILEDLRSVLSNSHFELVCSEALFLDSSFLWVG